MSSSTQGERVVTVDGSVTGSTITGLRNGVEYGFTVYALTPAGSSDPSETVHATPLTGMEGEVAGLIVAFEPGTDVQPGDTRVPGESNVAAVDLTVADSLGQDTALVALSEAVSVAEAEQVAAAIEQDPQVAWAEPDRFLFASSDPVPDLVAEPVTVPDDGDYASDQWNLWDTYGVGVGNGADTMTSAWGSGTGEGATVAVIDTGITAHPDLDAQLVPGYDFVSSPAELAAARTVGGDAEPFDADATDPAVFGGAGRDANPTDPGDWRGVAPVRDSSWHGTKVAGVIAAQARNGQGIAGLAPGAKIEPIRALSWRGGLLSDIAASITWASGGEIDGVPANAHPADVINLSLAAQTLCPVALQSAIDGARERGVVVVAAAGNANDDAANYTPGNCNGVLTVAATDRSGHRAPYSNFGERIDIAAPGGNSPVDGGITTTSNNGTTTAGDPTWATGQGTSLAAAHVSAAAAILKARNIALTSDEVAQALTGTVRPFADSGCDTNPTTTCGAGILALANIAGAASNADDLAMSFSGANQYVRSTSTTLTSSMSGAFTIEAWVRPASCAKAESTIVAAEYAFVLSCMSTSGGTWRYALGKGSDWTGYRDVDTTVPVAIGQWQHITVTRASRTASIDFFVNGQLANTQAAWDNALGSGSVLAVGHRVGFGTDDYLDGRVDEVRLYSTGRAASIATDMHTYGPIDTAGLVAYYDFNEGPAGTSGTGAVANRATSAPSGSDLRIINAAIYRDIKTLSTDGSNTVVRFPRSYLTAAGGWRAPAGVTSADYLVVGGGASGSRGTAGVNFGAGGGGGGVSTGTESLSPGSAYGVTVGQGGLSWPTTAGINGRSGQPSTVLVSSAPLITATGGDATLAAATTGGSSGSGTRSGTMYQFAGGAGTGTYGAGGGGGAGGTGTGVNGGAGVVSSITGSAVTYGSGGPGRNAAGPGTASAGAGTTADAAANQGGGGSDLGSGVAGGGSGIVVFSYAQAACRVESSSFSSSGLTYRVLQITDPGPCTWTKPAGVTSVDALIVAGGGGGGVSIGGGGGAGEMVPRSTYAIPNASYTLTVGAGGDGGATGVGADGGDSSAFGVTANGGGGGGAISVGNGRAGGSGGGSGCYDFVTGGASSKLATGGLGNAGGSAVAGAGGVACVSGGGGGAGGVGGSGSGQQPGNGGPGVADDITGMSMFYAAGGGGGLNGDPGGTSAGPASVGGSSIGGAGGGRPPADRSGRPGQDGTGAGGGGASNAATGGRGGSGVIVIRYVVGGSTCPNTATTTSGAYTVVAFKGVGSCAWTTPAGVGALDYVVVAGGGGGGAGIGGGGGAGGYRTGSLTGLSGTLSVVVGDGGSGGSGGSAGTSGGNSGLQAVSTTGGGGGGGSSSRDGGAGGSGGGAAGGGSAAAAGSGTSQQGSAGGGNGSTGGGGGGGASAAGATGGANGGNGGNGAAAPGWMTSDVASAIGVGQVFGGTVYFAGGGGGGGAAGFGIGAGGWGGGALGAAWDGTTPAAATAFTGGGGGGNAGPSGPGGAGGSGVVVISFLTPACSPTTYRYTGAGGVQWGVVEFQGGGGCTWTKPAGVTRLSALLVAGGGGGGGGTVGGGGGGGEVATISRTGLPTTASSYAIQVGAGGPGSNNGGVAGGNGQPSVAFGASANGGGGGGAPGAVGGSGGSAGGGSCLNFSGTSVKTAGGSGNAAGASAVDGSGGCLGAGGGGAGAVGGDSSQANKTAGDGGQGLASSITGTRVLYGAGGGGGISPNAGNIAGVGGSTGGGAGGAANAAGFAGAHGLGAGGGGGSMGRGGDGGDGVVIVTYELAPDAPTQVSAVASDAGQVTVSWTAPTYTGADVISGYSVTQSTDGTTYSAVAAGTCASSAPSSTSTSCTVTGLTPGTTYTFKVATRAPDSVGTITGPPSAATSSVIVYGALDHFAVVAANNAALGTQTAGTSFNVNVIAQDSGGRTVASFTGTVDLTSTSLFSSGSGTTSAFTAGVLASRAVTLTRAGVNQTITATRTGGSVTGSSAAFTINANTPSQLLIATIAQQVAGASFSATATLADQFGNSVNNTGAIGTITLTRATGSGTLGGTLTGTIAVGSSSTTISGVTYTKAESGVSLTAAGSGAGSVIAGKSGTSNTFAVIAGSLSKYALALSSLTPLAGGTVTVTAQAQDSNDNPVTVAGQTVTWSTSGSGGSFASATSTTNASGIATVVYTAPTTAGQPQTITATDGSFTGTSLPMTPQVGTVSATSSTLTASATSLTANGTATVTLTVQAKDANGNNLGSGGSAVTITRASGSGTLSAVTDNGNGTYTATVTAPTVTGTGVFVATLGGQAVKGGTAWQQQVTLTYAPGAASALVISTAPVAGASGATLTTQPVLRIVDANNNTVTSDSATQVTVTTSSGALSGTTTVTATNGIATFAGLSFSGLTATTATLTFAATGLTSATATIQPTGAGPATRLSITTPAGDTAYGTNFSPQPVVTARDSADNTAAWSTAVTATVTNAQSATVDTASATPSAGVATFSGFGSVVPAGTMSITYTSGGLTSATEQVVITALQLQVTAGNVVIVYGGSFTPGYTLTGSLAGSDAISGMTYTYSGSGATVYAPSTTAPTAVGDYTITPSAMTLSPGSTANYVTTYVAGTLTIGQASQIITFTQPAGKTYLDAPFTLTPTSTSGLAVTLTSSTNAVCTVASNVVTLVGAGDCTLTASQAGNGNYIPANAVSHTFTVSRAAQASLVMTSPAAASFGETISLAASGGSGNGSLSFSVTSPAGSNRCAATGSTLTLGDAGTVCKVQATKAADANYALATSTEQTITIAQAGQTIAFTSSVPTAPLPNGAYTPTARALSTVTGAASGVTVAMTATGTCTIAGGVVTFTAAGLCTITANASANTNFTAATAVTQTIAVGSLNQTITFPQPANRSFGSASFAAGGNASSGLVVTYSLGSGTTNSACAVSTLGAVTIQAVGTCEIDAAQAGDAQYAAASDVTRAFQITPALATAPTLTSASASSQAITLGFTAPGFAGGVPITAYRVVATPTGGGPVITDTACASSPCTITGLTNGTPYSVTVAAINAAGTGPASSASAPLTPATAAFAVGGLAAASGNTSVTLTWIPLTTQQLGGGSFTRYEVSKRIAGSSTWTIVSTSLTSQSASSFTVTGLDNGTSYDFQVVAITTANSTEIPANTAQVIQYPAATPSTPRSPTILASTPTDVQFSWVAPLSDGGAALTAPNYSVTVTGSAGAVAVSCTPASATAATCLAANLTSGALYTFAVVANNRMGASSAASATYAVPSSDATLASLAVSADSGPVHLSPVFAPGTFGYQATVPFADATVELTPTTNAAGATVSVAGVAVASGSISAPIAVTVGVTTIQVDVVASDPRFSETYEVTITRLPPPPTPNAGADWSREAWLLAQLEPVQPPAWTSSAGTGTGTVLTDGAVTQVQWERLQTGWRAVGAGFDFSVTTSSPLPQNGKLSAVEGTAVDVSAIGYRADSFIKVFAIPVGANARSTARTTLGATYIGAVTIGASGTGQASLTLPTMLIAGQYVLQANGLTAESAVRSVSLPMQVDKAVHLSAGRIQRSAFFAPKSDLLSKAGRHRIDEIVRAIPAGATNVRVSIVGVSVSLASPSANLDLARDRAKQMVRQLKLRDVAGEYTVSVSTTFTVKADAKARMLAADGSLQMLGAPDGPTVTPVVDGSGRPLTTVVVTYTAPVAT